MKLNKVTEGGVELFVPVVSRIIAKNPAFFNPVQVTNRDISVLLSACLLNKNSAVLDLLSATGVRAIRFAKEAGLKNIFANDANPTAVKLIRKNAVHNKIKLNIFNLRAHEFLARKYQLNKKIYFDYIDIDPFGTPVPFIDAAVKALNPRGGILAVTATDTANLCGVNANACRRIYQSRPIRSELMHEIGIRILLKKIIEVGAQYELALTPIFVHSTLHYMRAYLRAESGAKKADEVLKQVGMYAGAGPMWLGRLWDEKLVEQMRKLARQARYYENTKAGTIRKLEKEFGLQIPRNIKISWETQKLLHTIADESEINSFGFYDLATLKLKQIPKISDVIAALHTNGFAATRTHFNPMGIRTNADKTIFLKCLWLNSDKKPFIKISKPSAY